MTKYGMVIDLDKCLGCAACVAACITENRRQQADKAVEQGLDAVRSLWLRTWAERLELGEYPSVKSTIMHHICQHCEDAPCVHVCPTGAAFKTEDGVILVDKDLCIGCEFCVSACPFNARIMDPVIRSIDKCTFCYHRVKVGKEPACVEVCPAHARVFGDLENPFSEVHALVAEGNVVQISEEYRGKVYYKVPRQFSKEELLKLIKKPLPPPIATIGRDWVKGLGWVGVGLVTAASVGLIIINEINRRRREMVAVKSAKEALKGEEKTEGSREEKEVK